MLIGDGAQVWNVNPLIVSVDGFLSGAECETIIALARGHLERATVIDPEHRIAYSDERTNSHCIIAPRQNAALATLCLKLGALLRLPFPNAEGVSVLHYAPGQQFREHADGFSIEREPDYVAAIEANGGQRLFTTICYLSDVEEGGATRFPVLGCEVTPKRGRLLIFANTLAGSRDVTGLVNHAGTPVTKGEKWAATVWWRERTWVPTP
ncbi:MAG: 2OG-Fe(II) oxygenase [Thermohalobaculum sp.]|nr:2OG-Fe(II) oxygenase [Thermohalobaculum sp.]